MHRNAGPMTLPGDWAPRIPSPEGSIEENNNLSQNFGRISSRSVSENLLNPILHSSRESDENRLGANGGRQDNREPLHAEALNEPVPNFQAEHPIRRPLPQPRPFEGRGDRNIVQFFVVYERYAASMWGARNSDWVAGLEVLLQGWALRLYRGLVEQGADYRKIKKDLLSAFPGVIDPLRTRNLLKLLNIKQESGEPLPVFFARIDQLVAETYPDLNEHSHGLQVRDTFLMKLSPELASKIASYCNTRGDFDPIRVREAATVISNSDNFHSKTEEENVYLINATQAAASGPIKTTADTMGDKSMRCYICAGPWHPVSACALYPLVFSCPLCRGEPHAITECDLYKDWISFQQFSRGNTYRNQNSGYERYSRPPSYSRNVNEFRGNNNVEDYRAGYSRYNRPPYRQVGNNIPENRNNIRDMRRPGYEGQRPLGDGGRRDPRRADSGNPRYRERSQEEQEYMNRARYNRQPLNIQRNNNQRPSEN